MLPSNKTRLAFSNVFAVPVDQYAIRYAKETEIFWCGRNAEIDLEYGAEVEKADNMTLTEMSTLHLRHHCPITSLVLVPMFFH